MKALFVILLPAAIFAACAHERPPPRICERPPPSSTKKEVTIGTCPIDWGPDAGIDAPQEASVDAPHDG